MIKRLQFALNHYHSHVNHGVQNVVHPSSKIEQSFNIYISSLCKQKLFKDALQTFDVLEKNANCLVDPSTYALLISACSSLRSIEYARKIHNHILESNLLPNMILENHIVNMYGKCGFTKDARKVFDNMWERNVVSWTALIAGYSQNGPDIEAIKLYIQMQQSGFMPDHFTFGSVIKACSGLTEVDLGDQLHAQVIKSEFGSHLIAQNALIAMYTKFGRINEACSVFSRIKSKDLISWSSMIAGFSKLGYELEALCCFKEMLFQGTYYPNEFIFGSVFSACGCLGQPEYGRQIHGISIKYGFKGDAFAGCSLTDMYAKCGFLCSAKTAFDLIESPDIASWNAVIAGFAYGGDANEAMLIFSQMRHLGLAPDDITVRSLLCGFADPFGLSQGKQLHSYIIKIGLDMDIPVCNTLLTMYANCSDFMDAYKMFNDIQGNADLVSWNAIITMCMHQHQVAEVFLLFRTMLLFQGRPDHITLANVLGACGKFASLEMGHQVYCFAVKNGLDFDIIVMNGLIDMYVKCGSLERARKLFDCMQNPDVVSWTSLIVGCAQFGYGEEALNLFSRMKNQGIKPNQVTLVGVLTACSHVGLVEEGMQLFNSMEQEHGVVPTREHFSCVVDLLARAGRIHDAEAFISQMVVEPDIVMWKTLLAACKNRCNIEVGKRVAENILKMDPSNSAAHVLLCGMYASAGGWKDAATMRTLMREKGVKKVPGQSWIEVKDRVHVFSAEDGLHPERDRIVSMLEELWLQILDADCISSLE
ncbi:pentatricopeptide repeat-containing protein At3g53360, mitochondrial [Sesamum indicum]|uniref:Pentatricopeptide repeat-containing protein At3g53360, mitochondrial n=1 Tax=Sesamum indicum TaxID=4182 RepID=A0A6I9SZT8_SESIN|nr:pentatricopeptide repeat-containing protein At3g53360, mitochondrial [Sesamum indicum]XP_020548803.1 pentatricopeptide repeat-containing protein At3g53360, mitochondrial [Sesamum indicum]